MKKEFNVIIEGGDDGYYISEVIGLPGCHTQAKTLNELMARTKEAAGIDVHDVTHIEIHYSTDPFIVYNQQKGL